MQVHILVDILICSSLNIAECFRVRLNFKMWIDILVDVLTHVDIVTMGNVSLNW